MKKTGSLSALGAIALIASVLLTTGVSDAAPAKWARHSDAAAQFRKAGITSVSSGGCTNWEQRNCTSFTNINKATVSGAIAFKQASRCKVIITGGTEKGHAPGTYSHRNGYKVDMSRGKAVARCLDSYITRTFTYAGKRGDGARMYKSPAGNVYANERSHWDVTYFKARV
ncbi:MULTISPECIES: hypothetical protein [unclassified Streptomyces]|uniref:hypothetical protein n=1 Tax=unclassified Streptomyces TaxID=2593676 RepID=UPI00081F4920|nr:MULTISPECIES: hypothetical protein [unclassified Streptomyces]SCF64373.1 hypothetical protein GA0115259_100553 [Streptomyces sp. MnatMP-M17]